MHRYCFHFNDGQIILNTDNWHEVVHPEIRDPYTFIGMFLDTTITSPYGSIGRERFSARELYVALRLCPGRPFTISEREKHKDPIIPILRNGEDRSEYPEPPSFEFHTTLGLACGVMPVIVRFKPCLWNEQIVEPEYYLDVQKAAKIDGTEAKPIFFHEIQEDVSLLETDKKEILLFPAFDFSKENFEIYDTILNKKWPCGICSPSEMYDVLGEVGVKFVVVDECGTVEDSVIAKWKGSGN